MKTIVPSSEKGVFTSTETKAIKEVLGHGGVIVYPTDTLYGLGADATSSVAVDSLYTLKERSDAPVSVLLESTTQLFEMATDLSVRAQDLIRTFMPGALTVICRSRYEFAPRLVSKSGTVGFRVPGDMLSTKLPALLGKPITTTSVNPGGLVPATSRSEVEAYYRDQVELMIDIGSIPISKGSTVIDLTSDPFQILREGEISRESLQDFLN